MTGHRDGADEDAMNQLLSTRAAGVLLHPTSLPSPHGVGDLGDSAVDYVRWLARAGVSCWQVLPLNPPGPGSSPYSATSTFAGNALLVSPERVVEDGLLAPEEVVPGESFADFTVDYGGAAAWKDSLLRVAFERFSSRPPSALAGELASFADEQRHWLPDYCLFAALKHAHRGAAWWEWPRELKLREPAALERWREQHRAELDYRAFRQLLFFRQWRQLRAEAAAVGVRILGDVPIFVALDSAEVWARPELFLLDEERRPRVVAGVPPDYFSPTGQLWGNPIYDWERMAADGYQWWIDRLRHALALVDAVRLDHFRGFVAHWEVPAGNEVAVNGRWVPGPGRRLFDAVADALGGLPFVAEDLGHITPDVVALRHELGLPGMAILHFAFQPFPRSTFIPYALQRDLVVYTGTHDNNTTVGWFLENAGDGERQMLLSYAGSDGSEVHWDLIRLALASVCRLAVVPHQDLAGLGGDCRMNRPGQADGNWRFRLTPWMLDERMRERLAELVEVYGRWPAGGAGGGREAGEGGGGSL